MKKKKLKQVGMLVDGVMLYEQIGESCFRYALAHLLKLHPSKVPNFAHRRDPNFAAKAHAWLRRIGKGMVFVPNDEFHELEQGHSMAYNRRGYPLGEVIACVKTLEGGEDEGHAVYMADGVLMEYPSGERTVTEILGYFVVYDLVA